MGEREGWDMGNLLGVGMTAYGLRRSLEKLLQEFRVKMWCAFGVSLKRREGAAIFLGGAAADPPHLNSKLFTLNTYTNSLWKV